MISKMRDDEIGSRIGIVMNGSPLFTGAAQSGESEIRRWMLENDWVEAIVALPTELFYNTGIQTYIWLLTNRKPARLQGKVQLIDASGERFRKSMRKSLGSKRREIPEEARVEIVRMYAGFLNGENGEGTSSNSEAIGQTENVSRIFDTADFGHREIRVERPLKLGAPVKKAILAALSERDNEADICTDKNGKPESDTDLRDHELVPLTEDWRDYIKREVLPFVPNAWVDKCYTDARDKQVGRVGYEINFNRYFYQYVPPRPLEEIDAELKALEAEIAGLLKEVAV